MITVSSRNGDNGACALRFETTTQHPVEASGVGLHYGVPVRIRILPAKASTGIVFVRTDLENFPIPATWQHVARVSYATSLMRQSVLISTTEHLLSAFYSMGVDNAIVEIDNIEVPILDGSGEPFVRLIRDAASASSAPAASTSAFAAPSPSKTAASASPSSPTIPSASPATPITPRPSAAGPSNSKSPPNASPPTSPSPAPSAGKPTSTRCATWASSAAPLSKTPSASAPMDPSIPAASAPPTSAAATKPSTSSAISPFLGRPLLGHVIAERAGHAMHAALVARIMSDPSSYEVLDFDQLASRVAEALVS